jgi:hypothetical protein
MQPFPVHPVHVAVAKPGAPDQRPLTSTGAGRPSARPTWRPSAGVTPRRRSPSTTTLTSCPAPQITSAVELSTRHAPAPETVSPQQLMAEFGPPEYVAAVTEFEPVITPSGPTPACSWRPASRWVSGLTATSYDEARALEEGGGQLVAPEFPHGTARDPSVRLSRGFKSVAWSPSSSRSPTREGLAGCVTGSPHRWPWWSAR